MRVAVRERGGGWPEVGEHVPGDDGELYRVAIAGSRIEAGDPSGALCLGYEVVPASWADVADDEVHTALALTSEASPEY